MAQVSSNLTFLADYKIEGTGLSLLELTGPVSTWDLRELKNNFRLGGLEGIRHTDVADQ